MSYLAEIERLRAHHTKRANWRLWGPYLSDRAWGTVREDYSREGNAWRFFPHEHARSRVYRWNEDGIAGISDRNQYICFSVALWNEKDPILKERYFGLANEEGNHGEDVKEYYFYLDSTPTHSYMKMLYKYPQSEFPYHALAAENISRNRNDPEYELLDSGIFNENRYFDFFIEYAKASEDDILIRITLINRGPDPANYHLLPQVWFRNTWSWGYTDGPMGDVEGKPQLWQVQTQGNFSLIELNHPAMDSYFLYADNRPDLYFTENETNNEKLYGTPNSSPYVKDAFHRYIIEHEKDAINPLKYGTKAAAHYKGALQPGGCRIFEMRLVKGAVEAPFIGFDKIFAARKVEADDFYSILQKADLTEDEKNVQRQALAGLLWSKQLYYLDLMQWYRGDPILPIPPRFRSNERNIHWEHLVNFDVISMPDKWEYPWYASWDLAFHCIPLAIFDPDFAKRQLELMTREWYMHPNGELPAYEWNFSDVNPPVHAWATWRTYKIDARYREVADVGFLKGIFHKLLLNFTWWVNRKDAVGNNVFQGGFLGMDNISVFDRSQPLPVGGRLSQSDGTAWMGFYCLIMMKIALELSKGDPVYQDAATKFFEHFLRIAGAMTGPSCRGQSLWNEEDRFFYDTLVMPSGAYIPIKIRSLVGLLPLLSVETMDSELLRQMSVFSRRMDWFVSKRPELASNLTCMYQPGEGERRMLSLVTRERLIDILKYMLDENEFLSEFGIRSLSKYHEAHPYCLELEGKSFNVAYEPGESESFLYGGNSNWRGPIWFPINFLLIEALQKFHHYYGDDLKIEYPTRSGNYFTLFEIATDLSKRLNKLFLKDENGRRPIYGNDRIFREDPYWKELILFHEFFHGDTGKGLGASHQTGWTALVAKLLQQSGGL